MTLPTKILPLLLTLSPLLPLTLSPCLPISLFSQTNPRPHFRNYSTQHGLPSPEVYCAFQDSRGYLWFGTDNGAARFDGYAFRTYDARDGLTSNVVFDIHEDAKGRIWFGTMTGEAFILEGDTVVPYRFNHLVLQHRGKFSSVALAYLQPEEEKAYFELTGFGFLQIDSLGGDSLFTASLPYCWLIMDLEGIPEVLRTNVYRPKEDGYGILANQIRERKTAPFEILSNKRRFQVELPFPLGLPCGGYFDAQRISNEYLLVFACHFMYILKNDKLLATEPFHLSINMAIEDEEQAIWLCLGEGNGLRRYRDLEAFRKGEYDLFLDGLSINYMSKDSKGGLWVTTQEKGVFYCTDMQLLAYDSRFGFSEDFVSAVAFKDKGKLFAGCKNGNIFQVSLEDNQIGNIIKNPWSYENLDLLYLSEKDALWCNNGYWKNGQWHFIYYFNPIYQKQLRWDFGRMEKLHLNSRGELLGCYHLGFSVIDVNEKYLKFTSYYNNLRERTFAVYTAGDERVWIGNARGLFQFKDSSLISPGIAHPAFNNRVEDIDELPDSSLVFGTKGWGVVCWQGEDILQITTDDGLTANMIEDVHVDENGILWVGTLNGLNKVTFDAAVRPSAYEPPPTPPKEGSRPTAIRRPTVRRFTVANGLPSNEIYKVKSYAGQVWLCTAGGLVKFHEPKEDTEAPAPRIQYLKVNGENMLLAAGQELNHQQNSLEFHFLAINYRQNGRIPYRYRLNEKADWQYTENLSVNYPQLPPGDYRFEVQAQNQDGYWSTSTTHAFTILPPWWNTWWARCLAGGLLLSSLFYYQRQSVARVRREAVIQQQVTELERSALQAQMNPHFIFNCLNSIQNFILQNDRKRAVEYLSRFAQLVRHNLNASVQGKVSLVEELRLLDNYLALEQERFEHRFEYSLEVEEGLDQEAISFPPMLIQPYVENAVIHGLAKKEGKGKVTVHFRQENDGLAVTVRDNGVGYRPGSNGQHSPRHQSVGMTVTQKRLELLGKRGEEVVQVELLRGADEEVLGTEVRVWIGGV
ncbi:MAG: histidine kinase [Phaeodactylibacter sp.]|nr:histidine kinase [Phaeodactylibacter sp.]